MLVARLRRVQLATATAVVAGAGLALVGPPRADAGARAAAIPAVQNVSIAALGMETPQLNVPWRVEANGSGAAIIVFGPGTSSVPVAADTVRVARSRATTALALTPAQITAASGWVCETLAPPMVSRSGAELASYAGVSCRGGRPGAMQIEWWFDRSSWIGWRQYTSEHRKTAWISEQAMGTDIYVHCSDGGTYNYRGRFRLNVRNAGMVFGSSQAYGNGEGRYPCGTSTP